MTSTAWQISPSGPLSIQDPAALDNLHLATDIPLPTPGKGQVRVRIHAAALNFRDLLVVAHSPSYIEFADPELTPCLDGAGVVEAAGPDSAWKPGDRVIFAPTTWLDGDEPDLTTLGSFGSGGRDGTLREHLVTEDELLVRMPSHFSFEEGAAFPGAASTAYRTFMTGEKPLRAGDVVVTLGTGGVSMANIQVATALGATVIATSSSDAKLRDATALGAAHTINYKTHPAWSEEVLRITNGRGADHVVDLAGSATMAESVKAVRMFGTVHLVGTLDGNDAPLSLLRPLLSRGITLRGTLMFNKAHTEGVRDLFEQKTLKPVVGKVFEYAQAKDAFRAMLGQSVVGKIVVKIGA